jgi:hypothetical protein
MANFALDGEMKLEVMARFITKGNDMPLTGSAFKVRLYDREIFDDDDCLGESDLDRNGTIKIQFPASVYENAPDLGYGPELYFIVLMNGKEIFRTHAIKNIDIPAVERYQKGEGELIDLGSFLIDV